MTRSLIWMTFGLILTKFAIASDFHSPRTAALGGAGHASPLLTDAIYLNPSFSSYMNTHALSVNYAIYNGDQINTPQGISDFYGHILNVSVLDGTPDSLFQAGVGFTRREDASFLHIGASKSIIKQFGVGLGAKVIFPTQPVSDRISDGTLSFTGILSSWVQGSFVVDNLFQAATHLNMYREYILGTKFNVESIVLIYLDPHWVPTLPGNQETWGYEAGIEFPFMEDFFLRAGYFRNSNIPVEALRGDGFGFGAGWLAPRLSLDYGYQRILAPLPAIVHNFSFTIYF